ncbi:hypothetical protein, partial [Pseudarcicella hirudinis]
MTKILMKAFALFLFSFTCIACTNPDHLEEAGIPILTSSPTLLSNVKANSFFLGWANHGDTTIRVKADKDILPALTGIKIDLTAITNTLLNLGNFRLMSIGGALSAGFRDGGLYREGQLTAFPNLVARQMGLSLNQPLFDPNEGNGSGYKTLTSTEPIASFKLVTNNLAYTDNTANTLKPYSGKIDSYAFPNMGTWLGSLSYDSHNVGEKFARRFFEGSQKDSEYNYGFLIKQNCDFFIFEAGMDDLVNSISLGGAGGITGANPYGDTGGTLLIQSLYDKKAKGILLNVPDILDLPYFNQITNEKIKKLNVTIRVKDDGTAQADREGYRDFNPAIDKLIPSPYVEKLMRGEIKNIALLNDNEVLSKASYDDEWIGVSPVFYNEYKINRKAKETNLPVVDIYGLYKKIIAGNYTTDDGIKVNPDWVKGNFFSADGIYPTAFGQAVIANEVIKTINSF